MENHKEIDFGNDQNSSFDIREIIFPYLKFWYLFVIGALIALGLAHTYLRYSINMYSSSAKVLVNDKNRKNIELAALDSRISGKDTDSDLSDLIEIIKSRRIISKVVENNKLNITYTRIGRIKEIELFKEESPIKVIFINPETASKDNLSGRYQIQINSPSQFTIVETNKTYRFGQKIENPHGDFIIVPNDGKDLKFENKSEIIVNFAPFLATVNSYKSRVQIVPSGDGSRILNVSLVDNITNRANLFIDELIKEFNNDLVNDEVKVVNATSRFINDRLGIVTAELQGVDRNLESYKTSNNITNLEAESGLYLNNANQTDQAILDYHTQLSLVDFMSNALQNNRDNLLPTNIGLTDGTITSTINQYNNLILAKEEKLKNVTEQHDDVKTLQKQINDLKINLRSTFKLYRNNVQTSMNSLQAQKSGINNRLSKIPTQERVFKDISRQQQIVEALYLFLLQKREESEIKAASSPEHIKIVDSAIGTGLVSPNSKMIYLGSLVIGLAIPFVFVFLRQLLNNKIHTKEDLEKLVGAPISGQIPNSNIKIISKNDNSVTAESFRMLRTNIHFLTKSSTNEGKVIYITSSISGEGKTYIASNLSQIMTFSNDRVLLIGADIRNPKILEYLGVDMITRKTAGVTNFLADDSISVEEIITKNLNEYKFDLINSGDIPPNPAELLMNGRFHEIIEYAKANYDYIIVDTAPINLVTDTVLIADDADITLYISRANYTDKNVMETPRKMYNEKILKNMAMVINDLDLNRGYGYRNGYGYGYGYGYSYSYRTSMLPWYKKIIQRFKNKS